MANIEIYIGGEIDNPSEQEFLDRISSALMNRAESAVIFANFHLPRNSRQIDFLIITAKCACHVELKNFAGPVVGEVNGEWYLTLPDGSREPVGNPYQQALRAKYAFSDEVKRILAEDLSLPKVEAKGDFYRVIESVVCIYPSLLPGSKVPSDDFKVRVVGYEKLPQFLSECTRRPKWNRQHWLTLAMHLSLARLQDSSQLRDTSVDEANQILKQYRERFIDSHSRDLQALVPIPLRASTGEVQANEVLNLLVQRKHAQLVGVSGCGKTHLAKHMALHSVANEQIPIFARAKYYDGHLSRLLDHSVAHLHCGTVADLLNLCAKTNKAVALIIDGFNECPVMLRRDLANELQAFYLRHKAPTLLSSTEPIELPLHLVGETLTFSELTGADRKRIFESYSSIPLDSELTRVLEPFGTSLELSLAARCVSDIKGGLTRADLFETYTRHLLEERTTDSITIRQILIDAAAMMAEHLVSRLKLAELERVSHAALGAESDDISRLKEALSCGLLEVAGGRCSFRHEMLQHFFEAEALVRRRGGPGSIAAELAKPRNRHLAEFVIAMLSEEETLKACLSSLQDVPILKESMRGRCGKLAMGLVAEDVRRIMRATSRALDRIGFEFRDSEQTGEPVINVTGIPAWS